MLARCRINRDHTHRMGSTQPTNAGRKARRGVLARPLETLVFLAPLILFYEFTAWQAHNRDLVAIHIIQLFWELFGPVGTWAPALSVVVILLATHVASGEPWRVRPPRVAWMYAESILLAAPLFFLKSVAFLSATAMPQTSMLDDVGLSIGAGIYEELVFRLVLVSIIMMIGVDLLKLKTGTVAIVAILVSSLLFAAYHHAPLGSEPFAWPAFIFRSIAGVYLAIIFWLRGYGSAAGAHAAYNVTVVGMGGG